MTPLDILKNYSHDFRDIALDELALAKMLGEFGKEYAIAMLKECLPEQQQKPDRECLNAENHLFGSCFECKKINGWNLCLDEIKQRARERGIEI